MDTISYQDFQKIELRVGKVLQVEDFPPKQIGPFLSECLTCGAADDAGRVALLGFSENNIPLGSKIY